ncbi:MAG: hypothetical protein ACK5II_00340 [Paracoccus sp. (in: a-proteobacteria)]
MKISPPPVLGGIIGLWPGMATAHDAFGDLGPFYQGLLHPLADPAQGILLAAMAILLARQPVIAARIGVVLAGPVALVAVLIMNATGIASPGLRLTGLAIALIGVLAVVGLWMPLVLTQTCVIVAAVLAGAMTDPTEGMRGTLLLAAGTGAGAALTMLFLWAVTDQVHALWGRIPSAVAGSWFSAIGIMTAALPEITG